MHFETFVAFTVIAIIVWSIGMAVFKSPIAFPALAIAFIIFMIGVAVFIAGFTCPVVGGRLTECFP